MVKQSIYILTNMNGNLNDDIELMWIFLMDLEKELEPLKVNQNCINRTVWNFSCGTSATHIVMLIVHCVNIEKFVL
jgi:hypothetical protein